MTRQLLRKLANWGSQRYCPACGSHSRRFGTYGSPPRPDARCLICNSSERERAQVLTLQSEVLPKLRAKPHLRVLHIAPEPGVARVLRSIPGVSYMSGDFAPGRAMAVMDLTALPLSDGAADLIFVSHVLEHIPDDRRAISELFRVLSPGGIAFVEVPVLRLKTFEDPRVERPEERLRVFGQTDHVRICGLDYGDRLRNVGFEVTTLGSSTQFSEAQDRKMRLITRVSLNADDRQPAGFEQLHEIRWLCTKTLSQ
jgi:SAM-dependent methyltransferase